MFGYTGVEQNNGNTTDTPHFFINMVLIHLLRSVQPQAFLEWTGTSFEKTLAVFYTILLKEHLQVALGMVEVGNCSSLQSPKLTRVVQ
jgi:hypothetical protein